VGVGKYAILCHGWLFADEERYSEKMRAVVPVDTAAADRRAALERDEAGYIGSRIAHDSWHTLAAAAAAAAAVAYMLDERILCWTRKPVRDDQSHLMAELAVD
jgi:hypothetical protein